MLRKIIPLTESKMNILVTLYKNNILNLANISREVGTPSSNTIKTISLLGSFINIKNQGNSKLYSIKKSTLSYLEPIIERYRMELIFGIHVQLFEKIKNIPEVDEIYVFGSFVKGSNTSKSDLDLLIRTEKSKKVKHYISEIQKLSPYGLEVVYMDNLLFKDTLNNRNMVFYHILKDKSQRIKYY